MALRPHGHTCFNISHGMCNLSNVVECWYELLNHFWSVRSNVLQDTLLSWNIVNRSELSSLRHSRNPEQALLGYLTCEDGGKEDLWEAPGGKRGWWATWETEAWGGNLIRSTKRIITKGKLNYWAKLFWQTPDANKMQLSHRQLLFFSIMSWKDINCKTYLKKKPYISSTIVKRKGAWGGNTWKPLQVLIAS